MLGWRRWAERSRDELAEHDHKFNPTRHGVLGPELAAAHFVLARGGRVQFHGDQDFWWRDARPLPAAYDHRFRIKHLVVGGEKLNLTHEGVDNLSNLRYCETLDVSLSPRLNDFAFDKLYRQFRHSRTLATLDVSGCAGFSHRSLEAAYRVPSLQTLIAVDTPAAKHAHFDLIELLLKDANPRLTVVR